VRLNGLLPTVVDRSLRKHLPLIRKLSNTPFEEKPKP
jgi:hypothetical protein